MSETAAVQAPADSGRTSLFVSGSFPRMRGLIVSLSLVGGLLAAYAWSAEFVDQEIGVRTADALLGRNPETTPIGGIAAGVNPRVS